MNVQMHIEAATGHVSGPTRREGLDTQDGCLSLPPSVYTTRPRFGLSSITELYLSPLVDTLISPFCATL